ncbi:oxidoreductase [Alicycliphilus denitrificans]|uniref:NADPH--hemoprotein reductase n=2 Tax=Alicycliphilus denitrificans TaxID=179636 RepID=A0A858ZZK6_9BURK|nr:oxidoreductase [Alicycliphilus denitrificans]GAO21112.1 oxidoreductase FAD/NAD(P)-binding domain-containing protein [Alicycliphilus sp. B1]GAO25631.1 oxidoreductase FAD/NAD(P)-binding domain-containing protein [Alicycliphilus sp. B1]
MTMGWKSVHRWLGLTLGTLAMVLGLSGALLAIDPLQQAWQAPAAAPGLPVATLVQRVQAGMPGVEEIRRLPSGAIAAFGFSGEQAQALYVDPADGRLLGPYQPSSMPRWVKNLHRALLLGDAGRWAAAGAALAMAVLSVSGLVLLLRRMGGWRQLAGRVRGTLAQRLHVLAGRVVLAVLCLSSVTALLMSASTLGLVAPGAEPEPEVASTAVSAAPLPAGKLPLLQDLRTGDLRRLNLPDATDPTDTWQVTTVQGQGWMDRYSGQTLAWQEATAAQRIDDWARVLHTGESAWPWAVVLGLSGLSVLLFWATGVLIWWQERQGAVRIADNCTLPQADVLVFVASEGGSTWGFAQALHGALVRAGHRVHSTGLEHFQTTPATRQVFILAATYGEGQPPAHARHALQRIAAQAAGAVPVTVLGFGDRQYPSFCAFAQAIEQTLRARGWPALLPLECIHQQSSQQFARWGGALAQALGEPLAIDYRPRLPPTTALTLVSRRDYPGQDGRPTAILRFSWPRLPWHERLRGHGLARFAAGDLVGIVAPGSAVPRYYSLASGSADGFLEICVRQWPGGLCSSHLLGLKPGDGTQAFIRSNPGFALQDRPRSALLIGAGTGVAPLAGFIRSNDGRTAMHLYFGARDPARDYYFEPEIQRWRDEQRLASVQTAFSRVPGGGYVQDVLRRDRERLRALLAGGAIVRVCGSRPMAQAVAQVLDDILGTLGLSVRELKVKGRYAEDLF